MEVDRTNHRIARQFKRVGPRRFRLGALNALTDANLGRLDVDDLLGELLKRVCQLLRTDTAAVLLTDKSGRQLVARAACGIEEEVRQGVRVTIGLGFSGRIAAERKPIMLDRIDASTVENPLLWEHGITNMLGVPLETQAGVIGVLHVGRTDVRSFTSEDAAFLALVADRITRAIQERELEIERAAARVLQRSLLPSALPNIPNIEFAFRYVPAEDGGVGGDWYDAFVMPNGNLWLMIGDVAGHGLDSAVIMGRIRASLRSYALLDEEPEVVLTRASEKLQFFEPDKMATVLCGRLRPPYSSVRLASAGHLPPVIAQIDGSTRLVELPIGTPLGVEQRKARSASEIAVPAGSILLMYTDGLVERRGESLELGLQRLVACTRATGPEIVCREVMDALIGNNIPRDDIAVLALQLATT